jgi:hypothetical protein
MRGEVGRVGHNRSAMGGKKTLSTFRPFKYSKHIPLEYLRGTFNQTYDAMLKDLSLMRSQHQLEEAIKYLQMREFEAQATKRIRNRNHGGYYKKVSHFPLGSCKQEIFDKLFWEHYFDVAERKSFTDFTSDSFGNITATENVLYEFVFPKFPRLQDTSWCYGEYTVDGAMGKEYYRNIVHDIKFFYKEREGMAFCSFEHVTQTLYEGESKPFWIFVC